MDLISAKEQEKSPKRPHLRLNLDEAKKRLDWPSARKFTSFVIASTHRGPTLRSFTHGSRRRSGNQLVMVSTPSSPLVHPLREEVHTKNK